MDIKPSKIQMISTALLYATLHQDATCTTSKLPRSRMRELACFKIMVKKPRDVNHVADFDLRGLLSVTATADATSVEYPAS